MKLLKVLLIGLVITAMAVPVIAEDRLSLAGQMRVRGFMYDYDLDPDNGDGADDSGAWNDQRFRIGGKLAVAEGVSVNFRFDVAESDKGNSNDVAWGGSTKNYSPYSHRRSDIQFDKAYLQIEKNGFKFATGQMYFGGFGTGRLLDTVGTGFSAHYGGLSTHHVKQYDENNGNDSFGASNSDEDRSLTAAKYVFKGDGWSVTPMASYVTGDVNNVDSDRLGLGVTGNVNLGPVYLKGELDVFDGDAGNRDAKGTQFYLDGSMAATDSLRVGVMAFFADDQSGGDLQVTHQNMPVFADWHPENYGYWSTEFVGEFDVYNPGAFLNRVLGKSDNDQAGGTSQNGGGSNALSIYADLKATDDISMKFAAMYFAPNDDNKLDFDGYTANVGIAYKLAANTTLTAHLNYMSMSADDVVVSGKDLDGNAFTADLGDTDFDVFQAISGIVVKF